MSDVPVISSSVEILATGGASFAVGQVDFSSVVELKWSAVDVPSISTAVCWSERVDSRSNSFWGN